MKRLLALPMLSVLFLLASCGSDVIIGTRGQSATSQVEPTTTAASSPGTTPVTNPTPGVTTQPTVAPSNAVDDVSAANQRELLASAQARWQANRPRSYSFRYTLQCECDQGPWQVVVDTDGASTSTLVFDEAQIATAPYLSIEDIFEDIERALSSGKLPVEVGYDSDLGLPQTYTFNGPELASDGGFVLVVIQFTADPAEAKSVNRQEFQAAVERWQQASINGYDFTFHRICFCPIEYIGPYEASALNSEVIAATLDGIDVFDLDTINIEAYGDLVLTVEEVFAEVDRAIDEAASYTIEYDPDLGFPSNVFIDWSERIADEESSYEITEFVQQQAPCSTTNVSIQLLAQPELPPAIAAQRAAIFDAAVTCDIKALAALTDPQGFKASFGGGLALDLWTAAESRGEPLLLDLLRHLNLAYTTKSFSDGTYYFWPSAYEELEASDGTGLSPADYDSLLELYPVEELNAMFDELGGYTGYRVGIDLQGTWLFYVQGD
jgi:hypothetical protein